MYKINKHDLFFIYTIIFSFLLFFGKVLFTNYVYYYRDLTHYYYPTRFLVTEALQRGTLLFWNPYIFCGFPALASLQSAFFYPLSIFYYLINFSLGFQYFILFHFLIGGIGVFLLLRKWGIEPAAAVIGSFIFMYGGYLISMINILTTLTSVVWIPWLLLFFQQALSSKNIFSYKNIFFSILTGLLLAFQWHSGQPETVFISILTLVIFCLFWLHWEKKNNVILFPAIKNKLKIFSTIFVFFILTIIFIFIPFAELISHSVREEGVKYQVATFWSLHPLELITMVIPSFSRSLVGSSDVWFGQGWMIQGYLGLVTLVLAVLAIRLEKKEKVFLLILGCLGLVLALGKYTIIFRLFYYYLPGFNLLRYPVKFFSMVHFVLSLLAAFGVQYIFYSFNLGGHLAKIVKWLGRFLFLWLGSFFFLYYHQDSVREYFKRRFLAELIPIEEYILAKRFPAVVRDYFLMTIFLGLFLGLLFLWSKKIISKKYFAYFLMLSILLQLALVNIDAEPLVNRGFFSQTNANIEFLKKNLQQERLLITPRSIKKAGKVIVFPQNMYLYSIVQNRKAVLANTGLLYHFFDTGGYESIVLKDYREINEKLSKQKTPSSSRLIDLLNVRYVISLYPIKEPTFNLERTDYVGIYRNKNCLPRLFLVPKTVEINNDEEMWRKLTSPEFNPLEEVIIEDRTKPLVSGQKDFFENMGTAHFLEYDYNKIKVKATLNKPGWLVLTDTYYPGWHVLVDNKPDRIYRANFLFRGVYLNRGRHRIEFSFRPTGFRLGLFSSIGLVLFLMFFSVQKIKNIYLRKWA